MLPEITDHQLLLKIQTDGGAVRLEGGLDHRPYMRLQKLGWLKSQNLSTQETMYTVTPAGAAALHRA